MNIKSKFLATVVAASVAGLIGATHAEDLGIKKYLIQTAPVKGNFQAPEEWAGNKAPTKVIPCSNKNLKISMNDMTDQKESSRRGVLITIENTSKQSCGIQGRPEISFLGMFNIKERITQQIPRGFMPGPVILARTLRPNDIASMRVQWNASGEGRCKHPRKIMMTTADLKWTSEIKASICSEGRDYVTFVQSSLQVKGQPSLP